MAMAQRLAARLVRLPLADHLRNWTAAMVEVGGCPPCSRSYSTRMEGSHAVDDSDSSFYLQNEFDSSREMMPLSSKVRDDNQAIARPNLKSNYEIGKKFSRKDKVQVLINLLLDLKDSKEAIYGTLDAWVAGEQTFPLISLKKALLSLEKDQQWHKIVQVIKWMLSMGQGTTMGIYEQLIRALDKDDRAEEAHRFWEKRLGQDFHSVPWQLCKLMISIYYRNNMLERLVELFKGLEAFNRKPPDKSIVQKVADTYELLGLLDEKKRVLEKYENLFNKSERKSKKSRKDTKTERKKESKQEKAEIERLQNISESSDLES